MPEFTISLKRMADLDPSERRRIDELDHAAFQGGDDLDLEWSTPEWMLLGCVDGVLASQLGILIREVRVGNEKLRVGGIGGVATHPDRRRNGYAQLLMAEASRLLHSQMEVAFGLLACDETMRPYYARQGWQVVRAPVWLTSRGKRQTLPDYTMILPLAGRAWPDGEVDLCGLPW